MVENVVATYALPFGIATNFLVNGRDVLVPMVIEEPSVVAGASFAARLVRAGGGFHAETTEPLMIGQMQVLDLADVPAAAAKVIAQKQRLMDLANSTDPVMVSLHGGARDVEVRSIADSPVGPMLVVHLIYDCRDAMGANMVNTACEALAPLVEEITGGRVNLRILSNLADRRLARARCVVPVSALTTDQFPGELVAQRIVEAYALAAVDPYRAATHNKGIMNGVDAVVLATGNDWRAIEAGAHAYAARDGLYRSLSTWSLAPGDPATGKEPALVGSLELPLAVGTVGGATRVHPLARLALHILGVKSAASWPRSSPRWGWPKTWPPSAPWRRRGSSAATWRSTPGRSRSLRARGPRGGQAGGRAGRRAQDSRGSCARVAGGDARRRSRLAMLLHPERRSDAVKPKVRPCEILAFDCRMSTCSGCCYAVRTRSCIC